MSVSPYEIPHSWRRHDCTELCWQRFVQLAPGERRQILTYHDLNGHLKAWERQRADEIIETGPLVINGRARTVEMDGILVYVTPTEFEILHYLAMNLDAVCKKTDLLRYIWNDDGNEAHILNVNVTRLRGHLGPAANLVQTISPVGYRLLAVPSCAASDVPTPPVPVDFSIQRSNVPPARLAYRLGRRQAQLLKALEATPGRRLSINQMLTHTWGRGDSVSAYSLIESAQKLIAHGYPLGIDRRYEPGRGDIWLTGDLDRLQVLP